MPINFNLEKTLEELNLTRNKLSKEGNIRVATLHEMVHGNTQAIKLDTLEKILDTLNVIASKQGTRKIVMTDIIDYIPVSAQIEIVEPKIKRPLSNFTLNEPYRSAILKTRKAIKKIKK